MVILKTGSYSIEYDIDREIVYTDSTDNRAIQLVSYYNKLKQDSYIRFHNMLGIDSLESYKQNIITLIKGMVQKNKWMKIRLNRLIYAIDSLKYLEDRSRDEFSLNGDDLKCLEMSIFVDDNDKLLFNLNKIIYIDSDIDTFHKETDNFESSETWYKNLREIDSSNGKRVKLEVMLDKEVKLNTLTKIELNKLYKLIDLELCQ